MVSDLSIEFDTALHAQGRGVYGDIPRRHQNTLPGEDPIGWLRTTFNGQLGRRSWRHEQTSQPVRVWCDFVDAPGINACVFQNEQLLCISINRLTVSGMLQMFSEILRRSSIFPESGAPDDPHPADHKAPIAPPEPVRVGERAGKVVEAGIATAMPSDPRRFQLATFFQRLALDMIYFHELQHLLLGHLGFRQMHFGPGGLFELPTVGDLDPEIGRDLEFAADFFTGAVLADCVMNRSFVTAGRVATGSTAEAQHAETLKLAEHILFATGVAFSLFESQLVATGLSVNSDYPMSETRWFSTVRGMERRFAEHGHFLKDELYSIVMSKAFLALGYGMAEAGFHDHLFGQIFNDVTRRYAAIDQMTSLEAKIDDVLDLTRRYAIVGEDPLAV